MMSVASATSAILCYYLGDSKGILYVSACFSFPHNVHSVKNTHPDIHSAVILKLVKYIEFGAKFCISKIILLVAVIINCMFTTVAANISHPRREPF